MEDFNLPVYSPGPVERPNPQLVVESMMACIDILKEKILENAKEIDKLKKGDVVQEEPKRRGRPPRNIFDETEVN